MSAGSAASAARPVLRQQHAAARRFTDDVYTALRLQDELQTRYTGGRCCTASLERPPRRRPPQPVRSIAENFHLPYYTLTPTFSICEEHATFPGSRRAAPQCGARCESGRARGLPSPVDQWNEGKQAEFGDRRTTTAAQAERWPAEARGPVTFKAGEDFPARVPGRSARCCSPGVQLPLPLLLQPAPVLERVHSTWRGDVLATWRRTAAVPGVR